jgi:endonuclease YncB( thermonuclease family)
MCALTFTVAPPELARAQDRDCSDFDSQAEAQDFYENAGPGDPHRLDADDDGRACDSNPCPFRGPGGGGGGGEPPPPPPKRAQTIRAAIVRVIDGDTIVVRALEQTARPRYTVRLLGIDSPEKRPKGCGSNLATRTARQLAPRGRRVLLKTDPTQPTFDRYDPTARLREAPRRPTAQQGPGRPGLGEGLRRRQALRAVQGLQARHTEGEASGPRGLGPLRGDAHQGPLGSPIAATSGF